MSETSTISKTNYQNTDAAGRILDAFISPSPYSGSASGSGTASPDKFPPIIAIIIPSYKSSATIRQVICSIPRQIQHIIVVDDCCPDHSGDMAEQCGDPRLIIIRHAKNTGVGGAMISGYQKALELDCDIIVKMDADGQMDPAQIAKLVKPLVENQADYSKGNRFHDFSALRQMPSIRLLGNNILSFWIKFASGYWNIMDPTNGFTAIKKSTLKTLPFDKLARDYFFESDMLLKLNLNNAVVADVPIPAKYGGEKSSLSILKTAVIFPFLLWKGFLKRIILKYFLYDFNMASVYLALGLPLFFGATAFGIYEWIDSCLNQVPKTAGTIMLVALPLIVSFEMILQAIQIDISSVPQKPRY